MKNVVKVVKEVFGLDSRGRATKRVLKAFKQMGADKYELEFESIRLKLDDRYLEDWDKVVKDKTPITVKPRMKA